MKKYFQDTRIEVFDWKLHRNQKNDYTPYKENVEADEQSQCQMSATPLSYVNKKIQFQQVNQQI